MTENNDLATGFEAYRTAYLRIYPPPPQPTPAAFDRLQLGLSLVFILCLTIYAATRTAAVIEKTEIASGYAEFAAEWLARLATVGIEGMILFMAITHTRSQKLYSQQHAWVLIILGSVISALAGVSSGFGLLETARWVTLIGGVDFILALILGIGATVMVWASGEFVGTALHNYKIQQREAEESYRVARETYEQTLLGRWEVSDERAALTHALAATRARQTAELDVLQRQAEYDKKFANTHREKGVDVLGTTGKTPVVPLATSQADLAYQYLKQHPERKQWRAAEDVPSARDIGKALVDMGQLGDFAPASMDRARQKYIKSRAVQNGVH